MKITGLKTFVVGNPPPSFGGQYFIFVKLVTDTGIEGLGEVYGTAFGPKTMVAAIEDMYQRYVEGMDPFHIEKLWRLAYGSGYTLRPDVTAMSVLSAIEIALWDIKGKATGKPVYELLGGKVHDRLRSYTYIYPDVAKGQDSSIYWNPEASAERAAHYVKMGFTGIKFDPAAPYSPFDPRQPSLESMDLCEKFCKLIREAVGSKADLLFGTHGQFTTAGAIRFAQRIEKYQPLWFEEPTPPEKPEDMALVARGTKIPIATGERLVTKYEFARVLEQRAASILQMQVGRVGGLLEAKKITSMAEAYYAQIAPHLYAGPVIGMANVHLATCSPNFLILESIETWGGFHGKIIKKPVQWEAGYVIPPTEPGLGIELDEDVAKAHPYTGKNLHLEMTNKVIQ
ncbi:mandelate racemase/muconate lactonizing enzyme family protein [Dongia rigui]|uniref:Mandelate racemase/muconate lactonizing enzyme family protein n=1 Tax=Dongia rigui TaxID=940149 RepID=A0ABU5DWH5_9PROT|nr:mandelate racemase/muconate lactonizing enzyme family protein [Dongia rigui]MDY0871294.1 mandelate racemase/muconate lactonizing enzyme family protein [Dongia rigui]